MAEIHVEGNEWLDDHLRDVAFALEEWCCIHLSALPGESLRNRIEYALNHPRNRNAQTIAAIVQNQDNRAMKAIIDNLAVLSTRRALGRALR